MKWTTKIFSDVKYTHFLKWLLLISLYLSGFVIACLSGEINSIYESDTTYICLGIFILFLWFSYRCGRATLMSEYGSLTEVNAEKFYSRYHLWSGLFTALGFIGTIIGFTMALTSMAGIDPTKPAMMQQALDGFITGAGMALNTTLVGLICSIALVLQNNNFMESVNTSDDADSERLG